MAIFEEKELNEEYLIKFICSRTNERGECQNTIKKSSMLISREFYFQFIFIILGRVFLKVFFSSFYV